MKVADRALGILTEAFGGAASFRSGQLEAITAVHRPGSRVLVVQRTGWGKSLVYFVTTRLLREQGRGATLIVSPLLSLMRNQKEMANRFGLHALTIDSTNQEAWEEHEQAVLDGRVDVLFISPERLGNPAFRKRLLGHIERSIGLLVIDEAHCISDWGHDFRPDYRRILPIVDRLSPKTSILGTTATANDRVIEDVREQLGANLEVIRGPLMRESLRLRVYRLADQAERLAFLAQFIPRLEGSGIIYALTVNDVKRIAAWLQQHGIDAQAYYADLETEARVHLESQFQSNQLKALCATTALGMGYDKGDVLFVIHFQRPGSIISYYQQVGRAGRSVPSAEVVLLEGSEDDEINEYFITSAFPDATVFDTIRALMCERDFPTLESIASQTNFTRSQIEKAVKLMEVGGAVAREDRGYSLRNEEWDHASLRAESIMSSRRKELLEMQEYAVTKSCRMEFLARALDDPSAKPCGRCDRCVTLATPRVSHDLTLKAINFLRQDRQVIGVKSYFPAGFIADGRKKIPEEERLEPGLALAVYGDAGWGRFVREGKYESGRFADELIEPCVTAIKGLGEFAWLTFVPSLRRDTLVGEFARRLSHALGIPMSDCVAKIQESAPQKEMRNSTRQFLNAWSAFEVKGKVHSGKCILFDDIVDSGWTITAIGVRLRRAGAQSVTPFALATARPRDDV